MFLNKTTTGCLALVLFGTAWLAFGGDSLPYLPGCPPGVPCAPRRITYGFYPTHWRRWPEQQFSPVMKPVPEALPTPAREPLPVVETPEETRPVESLPSDPSFTPPFEESTPPVRSTNPSRPSIDDLFFPPTDDEPPQPPRNATPPRNEPTPPARERAPVDPLDQLFSPPGNDDAPPQMPDDDPFRDDPPARGSSRPEPSLRAENAAEPTAETPSPWREVTKVNDAPRELPKTAASRPVVTIATEPEPAATVRSGPSLPDLKAPPVDMKPVKTNPLRAPTVKVQEERVMPTSAWSPEPPPLEAQSTAWRVNGLRSN